MKFNPNKIPRYVIVLGNHKVGRKYIKTAQKLDIYGTAKKYTGNVLIVHGTGDDIVPYSYGQKYNEIYQNSQIIPIENADHIFSNDTNNVSQIVTDYFVEQLKN